MPKGEHKMMTATEIYEAVKWLRENKIAKFHTWLANNFSGSMDRWSSESLARELATYDLWVQLELVELMY